MINRDDWLAAIAEAETVVVDESALTAAEFAQLADCAETTARRTLNDWVKSGKAERAQKHFTYSDGRRQRTGAYRLVKSEAA